MINIERTAQECHDIRGISGLITDLYMAKKAIGKQSGETYKELKESFSVKREGAEVICTECHKGIADETYILIRKEGVEAVLLDDYAAHEPCFYLRAMGLKKVPANQQQER